MKLTNSTQDLEQGIDREALLHRITARIRQSLELQDILTATVAEIQSFLGIDRVMVYRFHPSGSGEVIAEFNHENRLPSLLGLNFPADDIPLHARQRFLKMRQRSIVHVASQQMGESPLNCPETGNFLLPTQIRYRPADPCHIQYLKAMGVQFSLVVPILEREHLWGLLVSHHAEPHSIANAELEFVQRVADEVSVAIAQSTLLAIARSQARREANINRIITLLHALSMPLQAALEETVALLQGCGGRLYLKPQNNLPAELYTCGVQPEISNLSLEQHSLWEKWLERPVKPVHPEVTAGKIETYRAIADIYNETALQGLIGAFSDRSIRSLLIVPLSYREQLLGYMTIFRQGIKTETWWAGKFDPNRQQLQPRTSFAAWQEIKNSQFCEWTVEDIELIQALGYQFSIAIQQHQLYQQVQSLNANLDRQVKERTEELQQRTEELQHSLELARVLKQVTDQIRSTLDLQTILQTIVREVRELLNTDRVVVYQFLQNWSGKVVVEEVIDPKLSVLGEVYEDNCFPLEYTYQYKAGRVKAVNNISKSNLNRCHIDFLKQLQVKANLVVPIRMSDRLWGLLVAHECLHPRDWQVTEIELLQQLADRAAIAIHQAQLYEQSRIAAATATEKAEELASAMDRLQHTQSQLIQTEKMSSLGQLVAGVAHEINNPVNFIYGNLTYVADYTRDLIQLLELYQEDYPNPTSRISERIEDIELEYLIDDMPKMLSSMKVGAERIRQLVLSLRNFSRLDEAERKPVDIHDGIDSTLLILQHRLKAKLHNPGIEIIKNYGKLPLVECYPSQLNQVFMNILTNAIDALEMGQEKNDKIPNPTIEISTQVLNDNLVAIRIADNGPGMLELVRHKLFDPFFTTKPVGQGTGLGLAISYQIVVEKHGGDLKCHSTIGEGAEFTIEIPIKPR